MADIKISGEQDIDRLMKKPDRWEPPAMLDEYLASVRKVVSASRYTDMYRELAPELLHAIIRIKAHRCLRNGEIDVEELVDIAAYAALLRLRVANASLDRPAAYAGTVGGLVGNSESKGERDER